MSDFGKRHIRCSQIPHEGGVRIVRHDLDCKYPTEHEEQRPAEALPRSPTVAEVQEWCLRRAAYVEPDNPDAATAYRLAADYCNARFDVPTDPCRPEAQNNQPLAQVFKIGERVRRVDSREAEGTVVDVATNGGHYPVIVEWDTGHVSATEPGPLEHAPRRSEAQKNPPLTQPTECFGRENCDAAERGLIEQRDALAFRLGYVQRIVGEMMAHHALVDAETQVKVRYEKNEGARAAMLARASRDRLFARKLCDLLHDETAFDQDLGAVEGQAPGREGETPPPPLATSATPARAPEKAGTSTVPRSAAAQPHPQDHNHISESMCPETCPVCAAIKATFSERHNLRCRVIELEAVLREASNWFGGGENTEKEGDRIRRRMRSTLDRNRAAATPVEPTIGPACPRGGEIVDYTIGLCSCGRCPTPRPDWVQP